MIGQLSDPEFINFGSSYRAKREDAVDHWTEVRLCLYKDAEKVEHVATDFVSVPGPSLPRGRSKVFLKSVAFVVARRPVSCSYVFQATGACSSRCVRASTRDLFLLTRVRHSPGVPTTTAVKGKRIIKARTTKIHLLMEILRQTFS